MIPKLYIINFRFSPCILTVNNFYYPTNALNYINYNNYNNNY